MIIWTTNPEYETVPISCMMRFSEERYRRWELVNSFDESENSAEVDEVWEAITSDWPHMVMMLTDGQCIALSNAGLYRYPSWSWLVAFFGVVMDAYEILASNGEDEWDVESCPYGPPQD